MSRQYVGGWLDKKRREYKNTGSCKSHVGWKNGRLILGPVVICEQAENRLLMNTHSDVIAQLHMDPTYKCRILKTKKHKSDICCWSSRYQCFADINTRQMLKSQKIHRCLQNWESRNIFSHKSKFTTWKQALEGKRETNNRKIMLY